MRPEPAGTRSPSDRGRIAAFDNDGTLWCEKPLPIQAHFLFRRLAEQAAADPSLVDAQPWKAVVEHDYGWLGAAISEHNQGDDSKRTLLDAALARAAAEGWTVLSVKDDWSTVFAD